MDAHQISGVPMASTSWALELAQAPCVPPAGHCQKNATGLLITSQVHGCDWYGWCVVRPRWNWSICFWYCTNEASAEITGMWIPFCAGPLPVVPGAGEEPAGPGDQVDDDGQHAEPDRHPAVPPQGAEEAVGQPGGPAGADVPGDDQRGQAEHVPDRVPLGGQGQADADPGAHPPPGDPPPPGPGRAARFQAGQVRAGPGQSPASSVPASSVPASSAPCGVPPAAPAMVPPARPPAARPIIPSIAAASRARVTSRSTTRQPNAARTQNIRKMSSRAVRLITNSSPSSAISRPAMQPSRVDRVIRRVIRASSRMASEPISAVANRQPNELTPNVHSPNAMNSFPDRRVHDELAAAGEDVRVPADQHRVPGADVVVLDAVPQDPQRVRDVVGLVEDDLVRHAQLVEPQERAERGDQQRAQPAPERAAGHGRDHPGQEAGWRVGGRGGRLRGRPGSHHRTHGIGAGGHYGARSRRSGMPGVTRPVPGHSAGTQHGHTA